MSDLAAIERRLQYVENRQTKHDHFLFGNGEPGADERLRNMERLQNSTDETVKQIDAKLDRMVREREANTNQWIGGRKAFYGFIGLVTLLFGGGTAAVIAALQRFASLLPSP